MELVLDIDTTNNLSGEPSGEPSNTLSTKPTAEYTMKEAAIDQATFNTRIAEYKSNQITWLTIHT